MKVPKLANRDKFLLYLIYKLKMLPLQLIMKFLYQVNGSSGRYAYEKLKFLVEEGILNIRRMYISISSDQSTYQNVYSLTNYGCRLVYFYFNIPNNVKVDNRIVKQNRYRPSDNRIPDSMINHELTVNKEILKLITYHEINIDDILTSRECGIRWLDDITSNRHPYNKELLRPDIYIQMEQSTNCYFEIDRCTERKKIFVNKLEKYFISMVNNPHIVKKDDCGNKVKVFLPNNHQLYIYAPTSKRRSDIFEKFIPAAIKMRNENVKYSRYPYLYENLNEHGIEIIDIKNGSIKIRSRNNRNMSIIVGSTVSEK